MNETKTYHGFRLLWVCETKPPSDFEIGRRHPADTPPRTAVKYPAVLPQFWPILAILWLVVFGILMRCNQPKTLQY